jgi:FkbM family methyltransferase
MIITNFKRRFDTLRSLGHHIQYVLDIGAYRGDFTETVHSVWPIAVVRQIEADIRQKDYLLPNAIIALVGDCEQNNINFYTLDSNSITTGSSIYCELTPYYNHQSTKIINMPMTTVDSLDKKHNFFGNWQELGLVKIDTQGSELLILTGASNFISRRKPRYVLLECSIRPYNQGAPSFFEVCVYMDKLGYQMRDIFDTNYTAQGELLQIDCLFERNTK